MLGRMREMPQDVGEWGKRAVGVSNTEWFERRHYLWLLAKREKKTLWRISSPQEEGGRKGSRESSLALSQKKEMQQLYKPNWNLIAELPSECLPEDPVFEVTRRHQLPALFAALKTNGDHHALRRSVFFSVALPCPSLSSGVLAEVAGCIPGPIASFGHIRDALYWRVSPFKIWCPNCRT